MTSNEIKYGYTIQLDNGSIYTVYNVAEVRYICLQQTHYMCLKLYDLCNTDLSPREGVSPIVKIWDRDKKLVYSREETVTVSMEQIAKMLNVPVERLRIKE